MKCNETNKYFSEYLDGELSAELTEAVKEHLAVCMECHKEFILLEKTVNAVRCFDNVCPPPDIIVNVNRLIDEKPAVRSFWSVFNIFGGQSIPAKAIAVAIVAILVIYLGYKQQPSLKKMQEKAIEKRYERVDSENKFGSIMTSETKTETSIDVSAVEPPPVETMKPLDPPPVKRAPAVAVTGDDKERVFKTFEKEPPKKAKPKTKKKAKVAKVGKKMAPKANAPAEALKKRSAEPAYYLPTMKDSSLVKDRKLALKNAPKDVAADNNAVRYDKPAPVLKPHSAPSASAEEEPLPEKQLYYGEFGDDVDDEVAVGEVAGLAGTVLEDAVDKGVDADGYLRATPQLSTVAEAPAAPIPAMRRIESKAVGKSNESAASMKMPVPEKELKDGGRGSYLKESSARVAVMDKATRDRIKEDIAEIKKSEGAKSAEKKVAVDGKQYNYYRMKVPKLQKAVDTFVEVTELHKVKIANLNKLEIVRRDKDVRLVLLIPVSNYYAFFKDILKGNDFKIVNKGLVSLHLTHDMRGKIEIMYKRAPEEFLTVEIELTL